MNPASGPRVRLGWRWAQIDAERQDTVDQLDLGVADHGEIREVPLRLLAESLSLGALDGRHAAGAHGLGAGAEPSNHLLWVEGGHGGQRTW